MAKTGKLLGRVLGRCQEQLMEGSEQAQRAEASCAHLEDVICSMKELGPQASAAELDVGNRYASKKLQVQALTYDLQKLDIGSSGKPRRYQPRQLNRPVDHGTCIECRTIVGAGYSETSGIGGSAGISNLNCASQKKLRTPSQSASGYPKKNNSRRRRRGRDDDNQPPQRQNKPQAGLSNAGFLFGCPFYFHNNEEHQACLNYELKRIGDVRQHIYRFHVQPSHCPRCGIVFHNDITYAQRDIHERQRICEGTSDVRRYSGATSDQLASMTNAAAHSRNATDEERWYAIWDIMFPHNTRPPSPYVDIRREWNRIEVDTAIAQYWQNGGPQDFSRLWWSPETDVLGIVDQILNHFRDFNRTIFVGFAHPSNTHDTLSNSHMMSEAQSTLPSPSPRAQSHRVLASQPITSQRAILPVLLPQPTHIGSAHAGAILPNLDPNRPDDELESLDESI